MSAILCYGDTAPSLRATCFRRRTAASHISTPRCNATNTHTSRIAHSVPTHSLQPHPLRVRTHTNMSVPWRKNTTRIPTPPSYPSSFGTADSDIDSGSESGDTDAELDAMVQEEWEESLRQMEVVISIIVIPYFGKWFGRQWAFWGTSRAWPTVHDRANYRCSVRKVSTDWSWPNILRPLIARNDHDVKPENCIIHMHYLLLLILSTILTNAPFSGRNPLWRISRMISSISFRLSICTSFVNTMRYESLFGITPS